MHCTSLHSAMYTSAVDCSSGQCVTVQCHEVQFSAVMGFVLDRGTQTGIYHQQAWEGCTLDIQ